MSYAILRTAKANDQLYSIVQYIADDSGSVDAALRVLADLEEAILRLRDTPEMGSRPRYAALARRGYRVLIVSRWLCFYTVDHERQQVMLHAVVDARRQYLNLI